jgi:hypothetical protein
LEARWGMAVWGKQTCGVLADASLPCLAGESDQALKTPRNP